MNPDQVASSGSPAPRLQRDVLENDKPSFHNDKKLYTPSDFTASTFDSTTAVAANCEIIASSDDTDILSNLFDGEKENVNTTFNSWVTKLLENGKAKNTDLKEKIKITLSQQLQDGSLNYYEYIDLEYVGRLWTGLLNKIDMYKIGSSYCKKDILSLSLELYELKQISKEQFMDTVLQSRIL